VLRIILYLLTLCVVGALGVGAYKFVLYRQAQEYSEANLSATPVFVDLAPVYVPIVRDGDLKETRVFQLTIETREGGPHTALLRDMPRVQDLMVRHLTAFAERRGPENIDNTDYMKRELTLACGDLLGQGVVRNVLFNSILTRPPT
jgi:flagellar basal body-associated protein FliL